MLGRMIAGVRELWSGLNTFVKLAGTITALIGIAATGIQTWKSVQGHFGDRQALRDLVALADRQLAERDYPAAWASNGKALQIAPDDETVGRQQSRIAIRWLQNARVSEQSGPRSFTELARPLEDVLALRALKAEGPERATLEAHIGWARFLRSRDRTSTPEIDGPIDTALRLDPGHAQANAIKGFWLLWQRHAPAEARPHFDAALAPSPDAAFSDGLILSAWFNRMAADDNAGLVAIDYASRIRKLGRPLDGERATGRLATIYAQALREPGFLARLSATLPAADHVGLIAALDPKHLSDGARRDVTVMRAYYLDQAGEKVEARKLYEAILAAEPTLGGPARGFVDGALKRLPK